MQYKTELHAHSATVSPCASVTPAQLVERYTEAGYTTLVLTEHYCDYVIDPAGETWEEKTEHYLSGYRALKHAAKDRLQILLGCELRFLGSQNDYLVFGMDEQFLLTHPALHHMTPETFSSFARENSLLFVQAHPYRRGMDRIDPTLLDGMEVFNGHPDHNSHNLKALATADRYGLIRTSGSDYHSASALPAGGIRTSDPITSMSQLLDILRSGNYTLICSGKNAARDGLTDMPAKS
ncbi:MAG: PHP domain-containing protein [Ruminococcaceae bacterium]|nr:PHP domain-containing protein [Oscillospiraceae bacterium]